jgi:hypothetical protein
MAHPHKVSCIEMKVVINFGIIKQKVKSTEIRRNFNIRFPEYTVEKKTSNVSNKVYI